MKRTLKQACLSALAVPILFLGQSAGAVVLNGFVQMGDGLEQVGGAANGAVIVGQSQIPLSHKFLGLLAPVSGTGGFLRISTGPCGVGATPQGKFQDCSDQGLAGIDIGADSLTVNDDSPETTTPGGATASILVDDEWFGVSLENAVSFDSVQYNCFGQGAGNTAIAGCLENPGSSATGGRDYQFDLELTLTAAELAGLLSDGMTEVTLSFGEAVAHRNEGDIINIELEYTAVPIPAALPLFASGLIGLGFVARRKKKTS